MVLTHPLFHLLFFHSYFYVLYEQMWKNIFFTPNSSAKLTKTSQAARVQSSTNAQKFTLKSDKLESAWLTDCIGLSSISPVKTYGRYLKSWVNKTGYFVSASHVLKLNKKQKSIQHNTITVILENPLLYIYQIPLRTK